ncbi:pilus assembly protein N-terminal domain-containing protein [Bradyrhizobium sp. Pha-3]|uniref:pilus assembly protein N-terminal domain-containing protein n=1 Tax=Bradyrhizobium sp. Pha-3 TaxID=208375 RepID=UPI0035D52B43
MKLLALAALCATSLSMFPAALVHAAEPTEIEQSHAQITLGVDETKTFRFDTQISRVDLSNEGVVRAFPQAGNQIRLTGISSGRTPVAIYGPDGSRIYSATITVTAESGHMVRIYRQPTREEMKAAGNSADGKVDASDEYWCTPLACNDSRRITPTNNR